MPILNHHRAKFDAGTETKLEIFEKYLEAWLPTFINLKTCKSVNICDFFAGPGRDVSGKPGSPLIIIDVVKRYMESIRQRRLTVNICFNELDLNKFEALNTEISNSLPTLSEIKHFLNVQVLNEDFNELYSKMKDRIQQECNLFFIDQNGVKYMTADRILDLETFPRTDYLFFSASSYLKRFEYNEYFPDLKIERDIKPHDVHRCLLDYYLCKLGPSGKTMLYPFTIKKGNIYGLIFGSKHPRGVDKFLHVAWGKNPLNGEANFDIDADGGQFQLKLFEKPKQSKVDKFKNELREWIIEKRQFTNKDIYLYTLQHGFLPSFAKDVVVNLRKSNVLEHFSIPLISYDSVFRKKRIIKFRVISNVSVKN